MMPIVAILLSFAALTLNAQSAIPMPPIDTQSPVLVDQNAIPQISAAELRMMNQAPDLQPKGEAVSPVLREEAVEPEDAVGDEALGEEISPEKLQETKRLNDLPSFNLQTNKAPLTDVLTLLADACHMSYVGLEKGLAENVQISVNISKNPYETLCYLCDLYNVALNYDKGIWHFGLYNDEELITRIYHLKYNNQEEVSSSGMSSGGSSGTSSSSSTGGSNSSTSNNSSSNNSSSSGGSTASSNIGSTASASFNINRDIIKTNIETFLSLSSKNPSILTAEDFDVDNLTEVTARGIHRVLPKGAEESTTSASTGSEGGSSSGTGAAGGKVIYNSDNKSLYVLATRAQHQWIEKYLVSVDKPQKQILVETKIYETGMSPETALGVNITNRSSRDVSFGSGTIKFKSLPGLPDGSNSATLNWDQFQLAMSALDKDSNTTTVHYPRQVTISNRPVAMASVQQIPIRQTSTTTDTSSASQQQTTINYINVGTNISVLPRIIDSNKVQLDISVTVSSIADTTKIDNNDYPIVAQRDYKTQAIVESGYTLAIAGLKDLSHSRTYEGVPILSKLPVAGALFRNVDKKHSDSNLMIFITPTVLHEYRGGVKEQPQFITPRDQDYPSRSNFKGTADETYTDIMLALGGVQHQIDEYAQRNKEQYAPKDLLNQIDECENQLKLMQVRLKEIALQQPNKDVSEANTKIKLYIKDLNELRRSIRKHRSIL